MKRQLHQPGPISALKTALQYEFQDLELLRVALTHASALAPSETVSGSYQRLEFLGDRVLGLVIASMLHKHFPKADEGELARRFNHMVKRETCAEIAQELGVGDAMRIGLAEAQTGGRKKTALLADICESVIAAI
ncbi:MAG: ribonuclease III domain-containing protein, partial [Pseudomonadota bacterium]|nr:ribonuclease III domain-containing protein [Pseudomonadota bacterium]